MEEYGKLQQQSKANEDNVAQAVQARDDMKKARDELEKDCEWYRNYAAATDQKIIELYDKRNKKPLQDHYDTYLNNPDKWAEIEKRFPEFTRPSGRYSARNAATSPAYASREESAPPPAAQDTDKAVTSVSCEPKEQTGKKSHVPKAKVTQKREQEEQKRKEQNSEGMVSTNTQDGDRLPDADKLSDASGASDTDNVNSKNF